MIQVKENLYAGGEFYNISIVKGDGMDIYVPNKNGVKPDNKAIFPIGGVPRSLPYIEDTRGLAYVS